jgi:hypothetical protein
MCNLVDSWKMALPQHLSSAGPNKYFDLMNHAEVLETKGIARGPCGWDGLTSIGRSQACMI